MMLRLLARKFLDRAAIRDLTVQTQRTTRLQQDREADLWREARMRQAAEQLRENDVTVFIDIAYQFRSTELLRRSAPDVTAQDRLGGALRYAIEVGAGEAVTKALLRWGALEMQAEKVMRRAK